MRYAIRSLLRDKSFLIIALATLGLGIGATTAIFSVVNGVLLRPLSYTEPEGLYLARTVAPALSQVAPHLPVNPRHFYEWRTACRSCEQLALVGGIGLTLTGGGEPERLPGLQVSSNFFQTLGIRPVIGRDFLPGEERSGSARVVILSDSLWRRRFAADASVIGQAIQFNGEPHVVVGVLPAGVPFPKGEQWGALFAHSLDPLLFRPLGWDPSQFRGTGNFDYPVLIRLKKGATPEQASAEMNAVVTDFARQFNFDMQAILIPLEEQITAHGRPGLWTLFGAVLALLLIICLNLGNLMLVRSTRRQRESAIRLALGASRAHLLRHVLKEASVLVAVGGVLGLLVAYAGLQLFLVSAPIDVPRLQEVRIDWRVLCFAFLISAAAGLLCGLIPAWRTAKSDPQDSLRAASTRSTEARGILRSREVLVGFQVALSTALLITAGLLMVSFFRLMGVDKGFEVQHILAQSLSLGPPRYGDNTVRNRFVDEALRQLGSLPGVISVGVTSQLPLRGETWIDSVVDPARVQSPEETHKANFRFVSPAYWTTLGTALKQGRFFEETDRNRHVAIISEQAVERLWPRENAVGKLIHRGSTDRPAMEVIGVVADVRAQLEKEPPLIVYEPYWNIGLGGPTFVLRTTVEASVMFSQVRAVIASLDPELPIMQPQTMRQILVESVAARRFHTVLASAFAMAALFLASLGIYGVLSFSVACRVPELGIRIALGARSGQIMALVVRHGMLPIVVGLLAGIGLSRGMSALVASQLYGVTPQDPWTLAAVALLVTVVGVAACWVPARRASRLDPLTALRFE